MSHGKNKGKPGKKRSNYWTFFIPLEKVAECFMGALGNLGAAGRRLANRRRKNKPGERDGVSNAMRHIRTAHHKFVKRQRINAARRRARGAA